MDATKAAHDAPMSRGRPPLPIAEKRSEFMGVKLTIGERAEIDAAARSSGIPASQIIRAGALKEARRIAKRKK